MAAVSLLPVMTQAEEPDWVELPTTPDAYQEQWLSGEREGYLNWMIDQRNAWSYRIGNLGRDLDGFLAGREVPLERSGGYMRIGIHGIWHKGGEVDFDPRVKLKLELPYTEEKFRLIIENDPDEDKNLQERTRYHALSPSEDNQSTLVGAVRYVFDAIDRWDMSTDLGVKIRLPPDPFWRFQAQRGWPLADEWELRLRQRVYYYLKDGLGENTELYLERPWDQNKLLRIKSEAQWSKDDARFEFGQTFSILQRIDDIRATEWRLGILGENQPNVRTTDYFLNLTYRRLLYKDWLFYEVTPELLFPRDDGFRPNPSLSLGLEIIFSEH